MDYNYIKQLVERYWKCETSLEEEEILRAFFSQKDIPAELKPLAPLFVYEQQETKDDVLGDDFDRKMMALVEEPKTVKARTITMTQRLMPLFKAAAVVAIVLTLSNAIQRPFSPKSPEMGNVEGYDYRQAQHGTSVAKTDSSLIDTLQHSEVSPMERPDMLKK